MLPMLCAGHPGLRYLDDDLRVSSGAGQVVKHGPWQTAPDHSISADPRYRSLHDRMACSHIRGTRESWVHYQFRRSVSTRFPPISVTIAPCARRPH